MESRYNDLLPQAVQMELKIGGDELKKRLLQLDGDMTMCVQIEHPGGKRT